MGRRRGSISKDLKIVLNGKQVAVSVIPASSGAVQLWFDLMPCSCELTQKGEDAANKIITTYADRGRRNALVVNKTKNLQAWGDSIVFNCVKEDALDLIFELCDLARDENNLTKKQ